MPYSSVVNIINTLRFYLQFTLFDSLCKASVTTRVIHYFIELNFLFGLKWIILFYYSIQYYDLLIVSFF